ncbi:MAG: hypothetical protein JW959_05860 [Pirellulales bacterium]|nr:hypothetical protein [Pirellulales bacterium]
MFGFPKLNKRAAFFRRGEHVTVRGLDEILATLDEEGRFDGLPFMPEMVPCCGNTYRVHRRAERTCVEGTGMRAMRDTVFLEGIRCDGSAHDGCQRGCLFFWKEIWLKPSCNTADLGREQEPARPGAAVSHLPTAKGDRFYCQSTELAAATTDLNQGKLRSYLHDIRIGELSLRRFGYFLWMAAANRFCRLLFGRYCHQIAGEQKRTSTEELDLQPGELVEIKSRAEIEATLDAQGRNRGLTFEPEMALHCGRRYRVAGPLRKIILERNGKMAMLSNTVVLEGVVCQGICVHNCPRANHLYWREIWLHRV